MCVNFFFNKNQIKSFLFCYNGTEPIFPYLPLSRVSKLT